MDGTERFARHLALPEIGPAGQARLRAASVLVLGAGGLGCPALLYLAAAGIGRLGIVDPDRVSLSNLQRQVLYTTGDIGRPKTEAARQRLQALDPELRVDTWPEALTPANALEIVSAFEVVVDGTDNFPARYLANDACRRAGRPLVHGSVLRFAGQVTTLLPDGPCYRCLFPEPPADIPSCAEAGVLGALPGMLGSLMAIEAIKVLLGAGEPLRGRLLRWDALTMTSRVLRYRRDPACAGCGSAADGRPLAALPVARCPHPATTGGAMKTLDVHALADRLQTPAALCLLDVREPQEWELCRIPGAVHIPMGQISGRLAEIPRDAPVVVLCHHGGRSARVAQFLLAQGHADVANLAGGIHAWAQQVDPSMRTY